ncbi:MAG TPA: hypothetical protein VGJ82_10855 [Thermoanaerobaculia bacterium]|jgi:lysyl-tRNA synthetase class II
MRTGYADRADVHHRLPPRSRRYRNSGRPTYVERFELYVGGWKVANAFSKLNDADEQDRRKPKLARAICAQKLGLPYLVASTSQD